MLLAVDLREVVLVMETSSSFFFLVGLPFKDLREVNERRGLVVLGCWPPDVGDESEFSIVASSESMSFVETRSDSFSGNVLVVSLEVTEEKSSARDFGLLGEDDDWLSSIVLY